VIGTGDYIAGQGKYVTSWRYDASQPTPDARLVFNWQYNTDGFIFSSPAIGDLDNNGVLDVVFTGVIGNSNAEGPANGSHLYAVRGDTGALIFKRRVCSVYGALSTVRASPVLADVVGDARLEILVTQNYEVHIINADGSYYTDQLTSVCQGQPSATQTTYWGNAELNLAPAVADLDNDGDAEIVVAGAVNDQTNQGRLYAWSGHKKTSAPWPQFHRNLARNGLIDTLAPQGPSQVTSAPAPGSEWRAPASINVAWAQPARDYGSGLAGYSVAWDASPNTVPDTTVDLAASATGLSAAPGRGQWYLHLRPVDRVGNGGQTVTVGPFRFDDIPPRNPSGLSASPPADRAWRKPQAVVLSWSTGGSDAESGLAGYSLVWDQATNTLPDTSIELGPNAMGDTRNLTHGTWHAHVRAVDMAGNGATTAVHIGPFLIDGVAPESQADSPPEAPASGVGVSWNGTDDGSGVASYTLQYRLGSAGPWATFHVSTAAGSLTHGFDAQCGGVLQFRSIAADAAGNVESKPDSASDSQTQVRSPHFLQGAVVNSLGQPVYKASVTSPGACAPTATSLNGAFTLQYPQQAASVQVAVQRAGFGQLPDLRGLQTGDTSVVAVIPPEISAIVNGGFESGGLQGWTSVQASLVTPGYAGDHAAQFASTGSLTQRLTVPAGAVVSVVYRITEASRASDRAMLTLRPVAASLASRAMTLTLPVTATAAEWRHAAMDAGALAGLQVDARISVSSNSIDARFDELTLGVPGPGVYRALAPLVIR